MADEDFPEPMELLPDGATGHLQETETRLLNGRPQLRCPLCSSYDHGRIKKSFSQVIICYSCMYKEYYDLVIDALFDPYAMDCTDCFSLDSWAPPAGAAPPPPPPLPSSSPSSSAAPAVQTARGCRCRDRKAGTSSLYIEYTFYDI